jgi:hypothetical protein
VKHLHVVNGSTITLTSTVDNFEITGDEWGLELGSQSCDGLSVHNAHLNGVGVTGTFSGNAHLLHSTLGAVTGPNARLGWCALTGALTSNGTGTWVIHSCWGLSGAQFDFGAGAGQTIYITDWLGGPITIANAGQTIYITDWLGGPITIANMAAGDVLYFEGRSAALTLAASCTGGTVYFAGDIALTNSGSGQTVNESSRYEISRILSDSTALSTAEIADAVWDEDIVAAHNTADTAGAILNNILPEKNAAFSNLEFLWVAASDHVTPVTSASTTSVTRSIDGGAFGSGTGTLAEVGNGIYQYDASAADMNGTVITFRFVATGGTPGAPDDAFVTVKTSG